MNDTTRRGDRLQAETVTRQVPFARVLRIARAFRRNIGTVVRCRDSYVMLLPFFVPFFLFNVVSVAIAMAMSFTSFNILQPPVWVGWQNYVNLLLFDEVFLLAIRNTVLFVAITGPLGYILSFIVAWFINELPRRVRSVLTLMFYAPVLAGGAGFTIFQFMFSGNQYGVINGLLIRLGITLEPIFFLRDPQWILPILIVVQLWLSLNTSFLAFIAGLQTVDRSLYEAAAIDGIRNRFQELWFITLPVMRPHLMFGAVMQITQSFAVSQISINLFGFPTTNYAGHTIVTHLIDYGVIRYQMGYASAVATVLFFVMVTFNRYVQRKLKRIGI